VKQRWGVRRWLGIVILAMAASCILPQLHAARIEMLPAGINQSLRRQAEQYEETRQWDKASDVWRQLLSRGRDLPDGREHYQLCLRRAHQVRRHRDATYRQQILDLNLQDSLRIYADVLSQLQTYYVDSERVELAQLFRHGLEELRMALEDEPFCKEQLGNFDGPATRAFQSELLPTWGNQPCRRLQDLQNLARDVALSAQKRLGLKPGLVVLELVCGACSALDEFTYYLTPGELEEMNASWKGECVGVGMELAIVDKRLVISQIVPGGPAESGGLKLGDSILHISGQATGSLSAAAANELLKGETESTVELELVTADKKARVVRLKRAVVRVASVSEPRFVDERLGIGYVQVIGFQETTAQELDVAVAKLHAAGMKVLILDLRGNLGGLFDIALQVAERFISTGVIVSTHGQFFKYNQTYQAHGMNVLPEPLVVLVDGETASSAEMLACALKDNLRGTLVGKTTFGKGCIQKVRKLNAAAAGIRMTVAKFFSPRGLDYSGSGVKPDIESPAADVPMEGEQDAQMQAALEMARSLAIGR
jgi:carboxyl-terminal processing protease